MGPQSLSIRLNALLDAHKLTQQSIYRLSRLINGSGSGSGSGADGISPSSSFNLDSSSTRPLPASSAASDEVRQELVSDIHESLKQQEEDLELLRQEIDEVFESAGVGGGASARRRNSEKERERARVAAQAARLGEDLRQYVCPSTFHAKPVTAGCAE